MITHEQVEHVRRGLGAFDGPVLSLYAGLAADGHQRTAVATRARETLRALDVPSDVAQKTMKALWGAGNGVRTLAIFATRDELQSIELAAELPVVHPQTGYFDARWGRTYVAPFLYALDRFPRHAIVYVDRDVWRLFEVFLGEIAEVDSAQRPVTAAEWKALARAGEQAPAFGGDLERNKVAPSPAQLRFFRRLTGERTTETMVRRRIGALLLLGPERRVAEFLEDLPPHAAERVVARLPGLSSHAAPASEVLEKALPVIDRIETRRQQKLLDRIARDGIKGRDACIEAAVSGRLDCLVIPWMSGQYAFVDPGSGQLSGHADERHVHRYPLRDVVTRLARAGHTRLEFVNGENGRRLMEEFDGLGGLPQPGGGGGGVTWHPSP